MLNTSVQNMQTVVLPIFLPYLIFHSISKTVASAKELDMSYYLGRACFVVLNATSDSLHCADMSDITGLCDAYDSPMLCASLKVGHHLYNLLSCCGCSFHIGTRAYLYAIKVFLAEGIPRT